MPNDTKPTPDYEAAIAVLRGQPMLDGCRVAPTLEEARELGAVALAKELPRGGPSESSPDDNGSKPIRCGACGEDIYDDYDEGVKYCYHCGQKL
jgi:hypothetical protein